MISSEEQLFLDAVLARAYDDGPLLIYADFLEESSDPATAARGELVRIQAALGRMDAEHSRFAAFIERQAELIKKFGPVWKRPLEDLAVEVEFRRGVPDSVSVDASTFLARGGELFYRVPIRRVHLFDAAKLVAKLIHCPFLAQVRELSLCGNDLGNGGVHLLIRSPYLKQLESLDLGFNGLDDAGVGILARATAFPSLRRLALNDNGQITGEGVKCLAESAFLTGLRRLDISGNDVNEIGIRAFSARWASLRLDELLLAGNHIGDAGLAALAGDRTGSWRASIAGGEIMPLLPRLLARNPRLDLRANAIGPAGVQVLARSTAIAEAIAIDLSTNYLGDAGCRALISCPYLVKLRTLKLAQNQIADPGAAALASGLERLPNLQRLDMSNNHLTKRGYALLKAAAKRCGLVEEKNMEGSFVLAAGSTREPVADVESDIAKLKRKIAHPSSVNTRVSGEPGA